MGLREYMPFAPFKNYHTWDFWEYKIYYSLPGLKCQDKHGNIFLVEN